MSLIIRLFPDCNVYFLRQRSVNRCSLLQGLLLLMRPSTPQMHFQGVPQRLQHSDTCGARMRLLNVQVLAA